MREPTGVPVIRNREFCEKHDKALFDNKHQALASLVGALRGKRVRVYECDDPRSRKRLHLTKEGMKFHENTRVHDKRHRKDMLGF